MALAALKGSESPRNRSMSDAEQEGLIMDNFNLQDSTYCCLYIFMSPTLYFSMFPEGRYLLPKESSVIGKAVSPLFQLLNVLIRVIQISGIQNSTFNIKYISLASIIISSKFSHIFEEIVFKNQDDCVSQNFLWCDLLPSHLIHAILMVSTH